MNALLADDIIFRSPSHQEAAQSQTLFYDILGNSFPLFPEGALQAYRKPWALEKIEDRIKNKTDLLLLAWHGAQPVGLVSGTPPEGGVGTIIWLLVKEEYRSQHLGRALLTRAKHYYQDLGCHKLKLTAPTAKARDFYLKQGMVVEGFHPSHWWQLDFWSLALSLESNH